MASYICEALGDIGAVYVGLGSEWRENVPGMKWHLSMPTYNEMFEFGRAGVAQV